MVTRENIGIVGPANEIETVEKSVNKFKLVIVGGGKMGTAMLSGFISAELVRAEDVAVVEPDLKQIQVLQKQFKGLSVLDQVVQGDTLILAVKPNIASEILDSINNSECVFERVISIMAGISSDYIANRLAVKCAIVRSMPNTPSMVASGMIAITAGPNCDLSDLEYATKLLSVLGDVVVVDEDKMDAVTAVSGSGPAYLFYFTQVLIQAAIDQGLDPDLAYRLAVKTVVGAAHLMDTTGTDPRELAEAVTSKGGTTQAALESLSEDNFAGIVAKAVNAASKRSKELGSTLK